MSCDHGYVDAAECPTCPVLRDAANADSLDRAADALERIADALEAIAFPLPPKATDALTSSLDRSETR